MQFLNSEGRIICLLEFEDAQKVMPHKLRSIDLLLVPGHQRDHFENSHIWKELLAITKHGLRNVVYF